MKKVRTALLSLFAVILAAVIGYVCYVFIAYYRLEDHLLLTVENGQSSTLQPGQTYSLLSYNVGFLAYSADFSFFMDGGESSRADSAEAVYQNFLGIADILQRESPDFVFLQEVDVDADRSWHSNELAWFRDSLADYGSVFAQNYDSPYLFWPLTKPHGASQSGIVTFSKYRLDSALRRSLPVETGLTKFLDLDRCYSVSRVPMTDGSTLCLYNVHLSAYTSDGTIATEQLQMLLADMAAEYAAGNYVVCGGDFNKDLLGNSGEVFGVAGGGQTWAQPFPTDLLPEGITLHAPFEETAPIPSCRNADEAYDPATTFVLTVDGFLVSDNVTVTSTEVIGTGFAWSDHQPVVLTFSLQ